MQLKGNVIPKGSELVAEVGDWGLYKSTLTLELSPESGSQNISISHMKLLTAGNDDAIYIDFEIAHKISGLNNKQLTQMTKKKKIKTKKLDNKKTVISLNSLIDYLASQIAQARIRN